MSRRSGSNRLAWSFKGGSLVIQCCRKVWGTVGWKIMTDECCTAWEALFVAWPLFDEKSGVMEPVYVFDRKGPPGFLRKLTDKELWTLQGRAGLPRGENEGDFGSWIVEGRVPKPRAFAPPQAC